MITKHRLAADYVTNVEMLNAVHIVVVETLLIDQIVSREAVEAFHRFSCELYTFLRCRRCTSWIQGLTGNIIAKIRKRHSIPRVSHSILSLIKPPCGETTVTF